MDFEEICREHWRQQSEEEAEERASRSNGGMIYRGNARFVRGASERSYNQIQRLFRVFEAIQELEHLDHLTVSMIADKIEGVCERTIRRDLQNLFNIGWVVADDHGLRSTVSINKKNW